MKYFVPILVLVGLFAGFYYVGNYLVPIDQPLVEWSKFVTLSAWVAGAAGFLMWVIYSAIVAHRAGRMRVPVEVFRLRRPWIASVVWLLVIQLAAAIGIGIGTVANKTGAAVVNIVLVSVITAVVAVIGYWVWCLVLPLPARVKYIPFLKSNWR
jgi:hypothetical protein